MSISPGWTNDEIRELVYAYERQPHGTKTTWLAAQGVGDRQLRRWRNALFDGDIDAGLVPRDGRSMAPPEHRRRMAQARAEHERELENLRDRVRSLETANEALGKAIGLLHQLNAQEPVETPTNKPPSSCTPRTSS